MSKTVAIVQARMGSTRLPGKVMKEIGGQTAIGMLLVRLGRSKKIDEIVVATTDSAKDDPFAAHLEKIGARVFRGSEQDVLSRYAEAAKAANAETVVRITGDCPLVDPVLVDQVIEGYEQAGVDYFSNVLPPMFPDGMDVEVFSAAALEQADHEAKAAREREHVTPYLREHDSFSKAGFQSDKDRSMLRLTLDEYDDLATLRLVTGWFEGRLDMGWEEIVSMIEQKQVVLPNDGIGRNEGEVLGEGQKLWKRAKKVIPGGNMLLSKRAEMFLPDQWPAYFSRTKGCSVWDMDGNELVDMGIMGVGTNTLGYSHPEVDAAVMQVVKDGNLSTLNAPEEVYLAERLVEMHPWFDMVRFARTGGEANAIAIRIARAASGRDGVAICGYHGWHDWYLSANLASGENLDGHLLPGLEPKGVPRHLAGSTHPFFYNDFEALEKLVTENNIGVIKMEVLRNAEPHDGFLHKVRKLATDKNIVLVFDECTSGFRETFGGLHKKYDVEPDIAIFGKTLGNGYAVNAVVGRESVMQAAQSTFISSTFWTERIGSVAALKALEVMEREKSWEQITAIGRKACKKWQELADHNGLKIEIFGLPAIAVYAFDGPDAKKYSTYLTQEMLHRGYLASTCLYASLAHTDEKLNAYFDHLDEVFATIAKCAKGELDINSLLNGPVAHSGFKRLN